MDTRVRDGQARAVGDVCVHKCVSTCVCTSVPGEDEKKKTTAVWSSSAHCPAEEKYLLFFVTLGRKLTGGGEGRGQFDK